MEDPCSDNEFEFLDISPLSPQPSCHSASIELGTLETALPYSPPTINEQYITDEYPLSPIFSTIPPPEDAHDISGWVRFFCQSHVGASPTRKSEADSIEGLCASLDVANSSTTLMDPETRSLDKSAPGGECQQDLQFIGDDIVLKCILDGMDEPSFDIKESPMPRPGGSESPSPLALDKVLPELRHRKDPSYEELPSISLITATPNITTPIPTPLPGRGMGQYSPVPMIVARPPLAYFPQYTSQHTLAHYRECQGYTGNILDSQVHVHVHTQTESPSFFRGSNGSFFLEPEVSSMVAQASPPLDGYLQAHECSAQNLNRPKLLDSVIRRARFGFHSFFRWSRGTARKMASET